MTCAEDDGDERLREEEMAAMTHQVIAVRRGPGPATRPPRSLDNADRFQQALLGREVQEALNAARAHRDHDVLTRTPPAPGCRLEVAASG